MALVIVVLLLLWSFLSSPPLKCAEERCEAEALGLAWYAVERVGNLDRAVVFANGDRLKVPMGAIVRDVMD